MMTNQNTWTDEQVKSAEEELELTTKNAKEAFNKAEAIRRLFDNEDFKLIIKDEYFEKFFKQVSVLVASNRNKEMIEHGVSQMKSVQHLRDFLNQLLLQGDSAKQFLDIPYEQQKEEFLVGMYSEGDM